MGGHLGQGIRFFLKAGSHRFENSWASPPGSHQPVVTYDLQLVQFHFFQLKIRTNIKLAEFQLKNKKISELNYVQLEKSEFKSECFFETNKIITKYFQIKETIIQLYSIEIMRSKIRINLFLQLKKYY
jgi:hypothetical protein